MTWEIDEYNSAFGFDVVNDKRLNLSLSSDFMLKPDKSLFVLD